MRAARLTESLQTSGREAQGVGAAQHTRLDVHHLLHGTSHGVREQAGWTGSEVTLGRCRLVLRQRRDDASREDQALQEGVGCEAIRTVHARAGHLTAGIETGDGRTTPQVRQHTTGHVVLRRRHGDQVGHRIDAPRPAGLEDRREALQPHVRAEHAAIQPHVRRALLPHAPHDRLGHDIARSEIGQRMLIDHEACTGRVEQHRTLTPHGLRDEGLLALRQGAEPHDRRVELDELDVSDVGAGTQRKGHTVARGDIGIRRLAEDLAEAPGREDHRRGQGRTDTIALSGPHDMERDALRMAPVIEQQVQCQGVLDDLDARIQLNRGDEGA